MKFLKQIIDNSNAGKVSSDNMFTKPKGPTAKVEGVKIPLIKDILHKNLAGTEPARSHKILHASDLTSELYEFCPREYALLDLTNKTKKSKTYTVGNTVTWHYGRALEQALQEKWLEDYAVGNWECTACGDWQYLARKSELPEKGVTHNHAWKYREVRVMGETSGVSGGLDLLLDLGQPKLSVVEVKSMIKDDFKMLKAPLSEHRLRTTLYLELIADDPNLKDQVESDSATVLYVSKSFGLKGDDGKMSPFKEFKVYANHGQVEKYLTMGHAITGFRAKQHGLPNGICHTQLCGRAQSCSMIKECFSGQFPVEHQWLIA